MKVLIHQMNISEDFEANYSSIESVFKANKKSDLIIAPEMCLTNFPYSQIEDAAKYSADHIENIKGLCELYHTAFYGSFLIKSKDLFYNRGVFISDTGEVIGVYDKTHLIRSFHEDIYFAKGKKSTIVEYKGVKIGLAICYDIRFPELFREYAKEEVELILITAQWPSSRVEDFQLLARARALENQANLIFANAVGKCGNNEAGGNSIFVNCRGKIELMLDNKPKSQECEFGFEELKKFREDFPALYDFSRSKS